MSVTALEFLITARDSASKVFDSVGRTAQSQTSRFSKFKTGASIALGAAGLLAVKFGTDSVKSAISFQKSTNVLSTAAGESVKNLGLVRSGLLDISSKTGTSLDQMTEGMYTVEKAGFRGATGLNIMSAAAKGAKDEGADLGTVTNALTSMMSAYGSKLKDPNKAMNALMVAAGHSKTTLQDYAESLGNVLPVASKVGLGFDQVSGALGTMTASGMSALRASNNLNHTIASLAAPTAAMSKEMAAFGLSSANVRDNLAKRGLQGTIELLSNTVKAKLGPAMADAEKTVKALPAKYQDLWASFEAGTVTLSQFNTKITNAKDLSAAQKSAIDKSIPAARGYTQAMKNMTGGNVGLATSMMLTGSATNGLKERTKDVGKAMGSTKDFTDKWNRSSKTTATSMAIAKQTFENAGTSLATKLLPYLAKGAQAFAGVVNWVTKTNGVMPALAIGLGVMAAAWLAMTIAASPWLAIGLGIAVVIGGIVIAIKNWGKITSWLKGIWKDVAGWFTKNVWDPIKSKTSSIWGDVKSILKAGWDWINQHVFSPIKTGAHALGTAFSTTKNAISTAWTNTKNALHTGWTWINSYVFSPIKSGLGLVKTAFSDEKRGILTIWSGLKTSLHTGWSWISRYVFSPFKTGIHAIKTAFSTAKSGIGTIWSGLKSVAAKPINFVIDSVYNNGIRRWWNDIASPFHLHTLGPVADVKGFAHGTEDHRAQIARGGSMRLWAEPETGGEAYIPLAQAKRGRSTAILSEVAKRFGMGLTPMASGGILGWLTGRLPKIFNVKSALNGIGSSPFAQGVGNLPGSMVSGLWKWVKSKVSGIFGGGSGGTGAALLPSVKGLPAAVTRWSTLASQALSMAGESTSLLPLMLHRISVESGGNPNAINLWDSNALKGQPSQGLMQTIPGTFAEYAGLLRGRGILDPLANMYAATMYTKSRYGNTIAGFSGAWGGTHGYANGGVIAPKLYDKGGYLSPGTSLVANHTGKPEAVLTDEQLEKLAGGHAPIYIAVTVGIDKRTEARIVQGGIAELKRVGQPVKVA